MYIVLSVTIILILMKSYWIIFACICNKSNRWTNDL